MQVKWLRRSRAAGWSRSRVAWCHFPIRCRVPLPPPSIDSSVMTPASRDEIAKVLDGALRCARKARSAAWSEPVVVAQCHPHLRALERHRRTIDDWCMANPEIAFTRHQQAGNHACRDDYVGASFDQRRGAGLEGGLHTLIGVFVAGKGCFEVGWH